MPTYLSPNGDIVIDDVGNFAFGTFDIEAWFSDYRAIQLSDTVAISWSKTANQMNICTNCYQYDATTWRYRTNGYASRIKIVDNATDFLYATGTGLADADITWEASLYVSYPGQIQVGSVSGFTNNGVIAFRVNDAEDMAYVSGIIYSTRTHTGNVTTGEDTLASAPIEAFTLATNQSLRFMAYGKTTNNANVKTLRVRLGATEIASRTLTPSVAGIWHVQGTIFSIATLNQESVVVFNDNGVSEVDAVSSSENTNTDLTLSVSGEATATNDVVLWGFKVWWDDVNS